MPAYVAGTAAALYPGDVVTLSASALAGLKTVAFAIGPNPDGSAVRLSLVNGSAVACAPEFATTDTEASYRPLTNSDTGEVVSVAATSVGTFTCGQGFVRGLFASDPGATTTTLSR